MICCSGWRPVERGVDIAHNLDLTPLEIKTSSVPRSGDKTAVEFFDQIHSPVGSVYIFFEAEMKYSVKNCMNDYAKFEDLIESRLPTENIWRISKFLSKRIIYSLC